MSAPPVTGRILLKWPREVAAVLGMHPDTVKRLGLLGEVRSIRAGRNVFVPVAELRAWAHRNALDALDADRIRSPRSAEFETHRELPPLRRVTLRYPEEVADALGVGPEFLRRRRFLERVPSIRDGRVILVAEDALREWARSAATVQGSEPRGDAENATTTGLPAGESSRGKPSGIAGEGST